MKIALIIVLLLIATVVIYFSILAANSKSGIAAGLADGKLSKCSHKPNCVCSEDNIATLHYIDPITISQNNSLDAFIIVKNVIQYMGGSIQSERSHYLAATFSSAIFGFVDDLELRLDVVKNIIHIRSASRVGHSDAGVNKKRVERLKHLFNKEVPAVRK
ncbi:DUF1499 domain-containing protein [Beggiatoa alba]|nr:DUF1499 domain-containing protein [Beggiatoa alba]